MLAGDEELEWAFDPSLIKKWAAMSGNANAMPRGGELVEMTLGAETNDYSISLIFDNSDVTAISFANARLVTKRQSHCTLHRYAPRASCLYFDIFRVLLFCIFFISLKKKACAKYVQTLLLASSLLPSPPRPQSPLPPVAGDGASLALHFHLIVPISAAIYPPIRCHPQ